MRDFGDCFYKLLVCVGTFVLSIDLVVHVCHGFGDGELSSLIQKCRVVVRGWLNLREHGMKR